MKQIFLTNPELTTTLSIMTFRITTFSIKTKIMKSFFVKFIINNKQA
jgi:hypothetical protein